MQCLALLMDQLDVLEEADVAATAAAICTCMQHSLATAMNRDAAPTITARACGALTRGSELLATPTFAEWDGMPAQCGPTLWAVLEAVRVCGTDATAPLAAKSAVMHALLALLSLTTTPPLPFAVTLGTSGDSTSRSSTVGPTPVAATAADVKNVCAAVSVCASMSVADESGSDGAAGRTGLNQQVHLQALSRLPALLSSLVGRGMCTIEDSVVAVDNVARAISG